MTNIAVRRPLTYQKSYDISARVAPLAQLLHCVGESVVSILEAPLIRRWERRQKDEAFQQVFATIIERCVAQHGMQLPLVVCAVSSNGSVLVTRVNEGAEPDVLAEHFEERRLRRRPLAAGSSG